MAGTAPCGLFNTSIFVTAMPTTVAGLGSATGKAGTMAFVTDSTLALASANIGTAVVGGNSIFARVYSDGTTWRIG